MTHTVICCCNSYSYVFIIFLNNLRFLHIMKTAEGKPDQLVKVLIFM